MPISHVCEANYGLWLSVLNKIEFSFEKIPILISERFFHSDRREKRG